MQTRTRPHRERVTIMVTFATVIAAAGLAALGFWGARGLDDWTTGGSLALLVGGTVASTLSVYIFAHFFWPQIPVFEPKQLVRPLSDLPSLPTAPAWLSPAIPRKTVANNFLREAEQIMTFIPLKEASPMIALLAHTPPNQHLKRVVQWEERVDIFLQARAPDCTALFNKRAHIPSGPQLREYLQSRINELKAIHAQL